MLPQGTLLHALDIGLQVFPSGWSWTITKEASVSPLWIDGG
jgi:hypothetical protein